jgi:hypothetical protein
MCGLHRFPYDLVEFGGGNAKDPCHQDAIQSSPIDGRIGDIFIQAVETKHEKHGVAPLLIVERQGFQNDRVHRLYVLDADNLRVQVRDEGGIEVGAGVDGAIIVIILGDHDPLGSGELLFQVTGDGLLILASEGYNTLACLCLIQGLMCGSHGSDESLLLSVSDSGDGLSHGHDVVLFPLSTDGSGRSGGGDLLLIDGEV